MGGLSVIPVLPAVRDCKFRSGRDKFDCGEPGGPAVRVRREADVGSDRSPGGVDIGSHSPEKSSVDGVGFGETKGVGAESSARVSSLRFRMVDEFPGIIDQMIANRTIDKGEKTSSRSGDLGGSDVELEIGADMVDAQGGMEASHDRASIPIGESGGAAGGKQGAREGRTLGLAVEGEGFRKGKRNKRGWG